ncbi:hypothetical protein LINPERHAP2_LOCUS17059 [Linum perenne]
MNRLAGLEKRIDDNPSLSGEKKGLFGSNWKKHFGKKSWFGFTKQGRKNEHKGIYPTTGIVEFVLVWPNLMSRSLEAFLWRDRNERVFEGKLASIDSVIARSKFWTDVSNSSFKEVKQLREDLKMQKMWCAIGIFARRDPTFAGGGEGTKRKKHKKKKKGSTVGTSQHTDSAIPVVLPGNASEPNGEGAPGTNEHPLYADGEVGNVTESSEEEEVSPASQTEAETPVEVSGLVPGTDPGRKLPFSTAKKVSFCDVLDSIGFGGTIKVKMNGLPFEFRRWVVDVYDVQSRSFIIGEDMRLKISEEDVHEVYGLPKVKRVVDLSVKMEKEMNDIVAELGLKFEKVGSTNVDLKLLRDRLYEREVDEQTWCQIDDDERSWSWTRQRWREKSWRRHVWTESEGGRTSGSFGGATVGGGAAATDDESTGGGGHQLINDGGDGFVSSDRTARNQWRTTMAERRSSGDVNRR